MGKTTTPEAHRVAVKKWKAKNPDKVRLHKSRDNRRRGHLRQTYNLSLEEFEAMVVAQGGGCAICRCECDINDNLSVDHDHETGQVRGLLCSRCNRSLGGFRDDPTLLERALTYLLAGNR